MPSESSDTVREREWGAVIPAKSLRHAKSRLGELGDEIRRDLVAAFLHDTVSAVLATRRVRSVVVVTDDVTLAAAARETGATAIPDGSSELNASLVQGAADLLRRTPGLGVLACCADLPALDAADLDAWLAAPAGPEPAFVSDVAGTGTTMLRAEAMESFTPAFGHGSRATHAGMGMHDLSDAAAAGLRHDVDTPADLVAAAALPLGERTRWVITKHRL